MSRSCPKYSVLHIFFILLFFDIFPAFSDLLAQDAESRRLPPGQKLIEDFPLLYIADVPDLNHDNWRLRIHGQVEDELEFNWHTFLSNDTLSTISDFHCVTGWSRLDNDWTGVRVRDVLEQVGVKSKANFVTFRSADGYTTSLPISECTGDDDILAFRWEGVLLEKDRGGPVRIVIPSKYAYKSALWIVEMELTKRQDWGYWEVRGYSNSADPWKEERYDK